MMLLNSRSPSPAPEPTAHKPICHTQSDYTISYNHADRFTENEITFRGSTQLKTFGKAIGRGKPPERVQCGGIRTRLWPHAPLAPSNK